MRVLGIDPSSQSTGFGLIEFSENNTTVIASGIIKLSRRIPFQNKLHEIKCAIENIIATYSPEDVAIENPFYAQNIKTAMTLGQVRGAILVAVAASKCALFEYSPLEIKKSVTGYGQAGKDQVNTMVRTLLNLKEEPLKEDESDALACAFCHLNTRIYQKNLEDAKV
ncbi:MAG: crossover junction endodeoxyribonuclease RuvC [Candidatus Aminicenantales bacterium]